MKEEGDKERNWASRRCIEDHKTRRKKKKKKRFNMQRYYYLLMVKETIQLLYLCP